MVDMSEASKQKSELWAADADAQSRTAEDLTITELTTPVPGRTAQQNLGNDIHNEDNDSPNSVAAAALTPVQMMARVQITSGGINMKASIEGDTGRTIAVTSATPADTLANSANNIANRMIVHYDKIPFPISGSKLLCPETEEVVLKDLVELMVKRDAVKNDGKILKAGGMQSIEAARDVVEYAGSGVLTYDFFKALINKDEFSQFRSDVYDTIKSVDEALYTAFLAQFQVDLLSFEGGNTVAVSVDELGRSMAPSHLVTPGLTDIPLKSRSLLKELLRLTGAATEMSLEDLIVRTNEALAAIQTRTTVTWLQHSNYFDEIARLISSFTEVAIVLSYELVEGLNRDGLSDVASIGAHFKTMLKLAPRNVQDLEPILAKFQEMTSTILQLEAEGTPQLEVLAQAKRLLGSYRRFLSDREEAEATRIAAESKISKPSSPTSMAAAAALPVTGPPAGPSLEDKGNTRLIENLKRENAALKKRLPGGGGSGGGGRGSSMPSKESMDEYHRNLARYHVLNPDGTIKTKRCGKFCRRMQSPHNPLHSVADAELYCKQGGKMTADAQGVLRCKNGEHPPWSEWTETMRGDGNPVPGPK